MNGLRSGELAEAAGVGVQTLRYYERRGLLAAPDRTLGGHRLYPPDALELVRTIRAAQRLGFTLGEIADLLATRAPRTRHGGGLHARVAAKLDDIEARLADLSTIRDTLKDALAAGCDDLATCSATPGCPLPLTGAA